MTFRTPVGRSTIELQETRGSLGHIPRSNVTNFSHNARINFIDMSILTLVVWGKFVTVERSRYGLQLSGLSTASRFIFSHFYSWRKS